MTASLSALPRRSPASLKSGREMPVLFHLLDVSRSKPAAKTLSSAIDELGAEPKPEAKSVVIEPLSAEPAGVMPGPPAPPQPSPIAIETQSPTFSALLTKPEFKPLILPESPSRLTSSLSAESTEGTSPTESVAVESPPTTCVAKPTSENAPPEPVAVPAGEPAANEPTAQAAELTPRSQAKTAAKANWFATHGKYIAIVFVIGLLGTIYLARTNRRSVPSAADHKYSHPGEAGHETIAADSSDATVVGEARTPNAEAKTASAIQEASPAQLATATEPQTNLHPPSIPQLAEKTAPGSTPAQTNDGVADANLFPWVKSEERVASRPESPSSAGLPAGTPPFTALPDSVPSLGPQYPVTTPVPQYPTTNTPTQYPFEPVNQAAPAYGPANGPALAPPTGNGPQVYPQDNSARGPRYERTGSGLY